MTACVTLPLDQTPAARPEPRPLLLIDGIPEPRLNVRELAIDGPLDRRHALLAETAGSNGSSATTARWLKGKATLMLPLRTGDGQMRQLVLAHGALARSRRRLSAGQDESFFELIDDWTSLLERPLLALWQTAAGLPLLTQDQPAFLDIGGRANRSASTRLIAGREVYVLQPRGQAWTVGTALETLLALAGVEVLTRMIPSAIHGAPLLEPVDLNRPLGVALASILEPYSLVVRRELGRQAGAIVENRAIQPAGRGATTTLAWARPGRALGEVLRIDANRLDERAEPWIARAQGWVVESTFSLIAGWDPNLEGRPYEVYQRGNVGFDSHANVYRLWALNEDGRFTPEPFLRGPAFEAAGLFKDGPIRPQPLHFLPCLTQDDLGQGRHPQVEMSLDAGTTWTAYPGEFRVRLERAAIYLSDSALPPAYFVAAQAGHARIRVTASLQSPSPVQVVRWRGNPFAGASEARVFELGQAFEFRRVAPSSLYYGQVVTGSLTARQVDQTQQLKGWLASRMERQQAAPPADRGRATLELAGIWPLLRAGDRLLDAGGSAVPAARRGAVVQAVRYGWPQTETIVRLTF